MTLEIKDGENCEKMVNLVMSNDEMEKIYELTKEFENLNINELNEKGIMLKTFLEALRNGVKHEIDLVSWLTKNTVIPKPEVLKLLFCK